MNVIRLKVILQRGNSFIPTLFSYIKDLQYFEKFGLQSFSPWEKKQKLTARAHGTKFSGRVFPNLVIGELFSQGLSAGLLEKVVEASFAVPNKSLHLLPPLLPLVAVANHVVQLMQPGLDAMLGAVPLAAHPLHWSQSERIKKGRRETMVAPENLTVTCIFRGA